MPNRDIIHKRRSSQKPAAPVLGVGSGRAHRRRVCKKCGTPGHVQKGCPEGREADFKFEPGRAQTGERYRVTEDCEDEDTGASWQTDDVWVVLSPCGPASKNPRQWRLRREGDGAEEVGFPTLHPFLRVAGPGGPSIVGAPWRVGVGPASDHEAGRPAA